MRTIYSFVSLLIFISSCEESTVQPITSENYLKFMTDKEIYSLNDPWLAKIINNSDSTVFISACGSISFGILKQLDTEDNWQEVRSLVRGCLAIYLLYYELTPKDTAIVLGPTPYMKDIISETGRYKFYTGYASSLNGGRGDTLFSNIFEVKQ
jgi:hypothetical protein